jgi:hypothetical protein
MLVRAGAGAEAWHGDRVACAWRRDVRVARWGRVKRTEGEGGGGPGEGQRERVHRVGRLETPPFASGTPVSLSSATTWSPHPPDGGSLSVTHTHTHTHSLSLRPSPRRIASPPLSLRRSPPRPAAPRIAAPPLFAAAVPLSAPHRSAPRASLSQPARAPRRTPRRGAAEHPQRCALRTASRWARMTPIQPALSASLTTIATEPPS